MEKKSIILLSAVLITLALSTLIVAEISQTTGQSISQIKPGERQGMVITFSAGEKEYPMYLSCSPIECSSIGALKLSLPDALKGEDKNCVLLMEFSIKLDGKNAYMTNCRKSSASTCNEVTINECPRNRIQLLGLGLFPYENGDSKISLKANNQEVNTLISWITSK